VVWLCSDLKKYKKELNTFLNLVQKYANSLGDAEAAFIFSSLKAFFKKKKKRENVDATPRHFDKRLV